MVMVRAATLADAAAVAETHTQSWGGSLVVAHGNAYDLALLPTLVALPEPSNGETGVPVGALAYLISGDELEIVSIAATERHRGVGTALLTAVVDLARTHGLRRVWLITTNDNLDALRFYQRRGLCLVAVAPGAVDHSRTIKPTIPTVGSYGIPLRDELTLELHLPD